MGHNTTRSVTLTIAGERLSLKTDRDEATLHDTSNFLSQQIEDLQSAAKGVSTQQIYLLVALKLADELQQERAKIAELHEEISTRSARCLELVDNELRNSNPR